jgi:hypothetical protein
MATRPSFLLLSSIALLAGASRPQARETPRAGSWEITVDLSAPGMTLAPSSQTECLSQADVEADPVPDLEKGVCRATNIQRSGDRVSWDLTCGDQGSGKGEVTYTSPTSYDGWMTLELAGTAVRARIRARRVGDC